ncbi:MAG TPA: hypothetical protein EYN06_07590 [Myxococcales bacterium]|nr:hypothetical protein [Myxococcales bacterium]HIN86327.1 hypothetical protein [Myxococcales bacterium]
MTAKSLTIVVVVLSFLLCPALLSAKQKRRVLVYSGKLTDERGGPVGGVFPLTFALYSKPRGGKTVWSERHFVSVDNGEYLLELGRKSRIPSRISLDQIYLGVRITGGPSLARERFVPEGGIPETLIYQAGKRAHSQKRPAARKGAVEYAEKAGFAYVAEKADNTERIDGKTLAQIKKALGGSAKIKLGNNTYNSPSVGGEGGAQFQQLCPDGYVMTGIRGGAGLYLDRMQIVCSPIVSQ